MTHLSPQFHEHLEAFSEYAETEEFHLPKEAFGECATASDYFHDFVSKGTEAMGQKYDQDWDDHHVNLPTYESPSEHDESKRLPAQQVALEGYRGDAAKAHLTGVEPKQFHTESGRPVGKPLYDGKQVAGADPKDPTNWTHHATVVHDPQGGPQVVDWTARQFDPDADFPRITSMNALQQEWSSVRVKGGESHGPETDYLQQLGWPIASRSIVVPPELRRSGLESP